MLKNLPTKYQDFGNNGPYKNMGLVLLKAPSSIIITLSQQDPFYNISLTLWTLDEVA